LQVDHDIKIQLLLGENTVNNALRQVIELEAMLLAPRLHKLIAWTF
jgi:hypothetical protein